MDDLKGRTEIQILVDTFYDRARKDDLLGPVFNEVIGSNWDHHLPVMYDFWNMVIFAAPGYSGQPVRSHIDVDKRIHLDQPHFDRWLQLWTETVDSLYAGEYADIAKNKAMLMANMINMKIQMSRSGLNTLN